MFGCRDELRHHFSDKEKAILRDLQMSSGDGPTPALLPLGSIPLSSDFGSVRQSGSVIV
jgi:hypothetical protein